jgi:hypothetical protein
MKYINMIFKFNKLFFGVSVIIFFSSAIPRQIGTSIIVSEQSNYNSMSIETILNMSGTDISKSLGRKLSLKERFVFLIVKNKLGVQKKIGNLDTSRIIDLEEILEKEKQKFHFGGFLLGFFLGLLGVIIAYTAKREKAFIQSAWFGLGFLIFLAVSLYVILTYSI